MLISWIRCLILIRNAHNRGIGRQKMARSVTMLSAEQAIRTGLRLMQWTWWMAGFQRKVRGTHWTRRQVICAML